MHLGYHAVPECRLHPVWFLLVSWKAFVQTNNAAVMAASVEHPFSWSVEFERLVVTTTDFQRLEVVWRALS